MFLSFIESEEWPLILRVDLLLSALFLILALLFVGIVLYLRVLKNIKESHRKKLEIRLIDFVNSYLFDEDFKKSRELVAFKFKNLNTAFDFKIATKQILVFDENLKGESTQAIKELYFGLGIHSFILSDLKRKEWFFKARALYALSKMNIKVSQDLIDPLINSSQIELRQQVMLYFLNTSEKDPLVFLDKLETPLTIWQQVFIENSLKNFEIEIPDFSRWLNHNEDSVIVFCIKMIVSFNQFQNIPLLIDMLDHNAPEVRNQTICALQLMEVSESLQLMVANFPDETPSNKRDILYAISKIGTSKELQTLVAHISKEEENLQIDFYKIAGAFEDQIPVRRLVNLETLSDNWEDYQDYSLKMLTGA